VVSDVVPELNTKQMTPPPPDAEPGAALDAAHLAPGEAEAAPADPTNAELLTPGGALPGRSAGFEVHLDVFEGPFDLLLGLIAKHKLDVTEIALAQVTDEFVSWIKAKGVEWNLGEASEFLVIAATLLDLKAARLLPTAEVEDEEDLALLEARDLLFARLLQYRAFKLVAAALAARAMRPKPVPLVSLAHLHNPAVSVREQAAVVVDRLRRSGSMSFRALVSDAGETLVVVARFLALLELFRDGSVAFDQVSPLVELTVHWTAQHSAEHPLEIDEFDGMAADGRQSDVAPDDRVGVPVEAGADLRVEHGAASSATDGREG